MGLALGSRNAEPYDIATSYSLYEKLLVLLDDIQIKGIRLGLTSDQNVPTFTSPGMQKTKRKLAFPSVLSPPSKVDIKPKCYLLLT